MGDTPPTPAQLKRRRELYVENREHILERRAAWYLAHKERIKAQRHRYYLANQGDILARGREYDRKRIRPSNGKTRGWRGMSIKQAIAAEHRVVEQAIAKGTLTYLSPYYGWSVQKYRNHFQLDTDHPISDTLVFSVTEMATRINIAQKGA
jgi:hypothetical protein